MFYAMLADLRQGGFRLPEFTSYNGGNIPFAYPPLAFYVAAGLGSVFGISNSDLLRFVPLIVSALSIPAFYLMATALLPRRSMALIAAGAFSLAPGFTWMVMGGGLTRSFGLVFALLAVYHVYILTRHEQTPARFGLAVLFITLTVFSHVEMAWNFAVFYLVILCACTTTSRRALFWALALIPASFALTAPWWGYVVAQHGLDPFIAAGLEAETTRVLAPLGLLGLALSRRWFLTGLVVAMVFLGGRNPHITMSLVLPLVFGYVAINYLQPLIEALPHKRLAWLRGGAVVLSVGGIAAAWLLWSFALSGNLLSSRSPGELGTFRWIAGNTPADARFLVLSDSTYWGTDHTIEWLPALAERRSVTTVQGTEWLRGANGFGSTNRRYDSVQVCGDSACLEDWAAGAGVSFTHVYIDRDASRGSLRESLASSTSYSLRYDGPGAQVFGRNR